MSTLNDKIAQAMPPLSHLECSVCGHREEVGNVASRVEFGWPRHCSYTMSLITVNQLKSVEPKDPNQ